MDKYFIVTRTWGFAKKFLKTQTYNITEESPNKTTEGQYVPHMTLIRPFFTENEYRLIEKFEEYSRSQKELIKFTINGFGIFNNKSPVIYAKIEQNDKLKNFTKNLENSLDKLIEYVHPQIKLKGEEDRIYHYTIAEGVKDPIEIVSQLPQEKIDQYLLRICLLKNKLILKEYDFPLKKSLSRTQAKNPRYFKKTIEKLIEITQETPSKKGFVRI